MIAVVGSGGQLGSQIVKDFQDRDLVSFDYPAIDLANPGTLRVITEARPTIIINCAAYTNVEKAEREKEQAQKINADGPAALAKIAKEIDALLVHISTDYVFDGKKDSPYTEEDITNPINVYGKTKLAGEIAVIESGCRYIIVRTAWLYGMNGPNFILKMLELGRSRPEVKVVNDQFGSPTFTKELAIAIMRLVDSNQTGMFHVVCQGIASWYDLAAKVFETSHLTANLESVDSSVFPTIAPRPTYTVLSTKKLKTFYKMPSWQKAADSYLEEITLNKA